MLMRVKGWLGVGGAALMVPGPSLFGWGKPNALSILIVDHVIR